MLKAENIHFGYGEGYVLNGVSFELHRGQIVGLFGENGAGKTTLMNCIAGILPLDSGAITLDGISGEAIRDNLAYVFSEGSSVFNYTPEQFGRYLAQFYPKFKVNRYATLLSYFNLPNQPIKTLSKGQQGKAELAAGCSKGADYILMDEPFLDKDIFTRKDFIKVLAGTLKEHETILLCTHFVEETENLMDRVLVMKNGKIAVDLDMAELQENGGSIVEEMEKIFHTKDKRSVLFPDD